MSHDHQPLATEALVELVCKGNAQQRQMALSCLRQRPKESIAHHLTTHLNHPDRTISVHAANALGGLSIEQAVPRLSDCLWHEPEPAVRTAVAHALADIGTQEAIDTLLQMLYLPLEPEEEDDFDDPWHNRWDLPIDAARALARVGEAKALNGLVQLLHVSEDDEEREQELFCLIAHLPGQATLDFLLGQFFQNDELKKHTVIAALAHHNASSSLSFLVKVAHSESIPCELRTQAIRSIATRGTLRKLPCLLQLCQHSDGAIQQSAALACQQLLKTGGGPFCVNSLQTYILDSNPLVRKIAQSALAKLKLPLPQAADSEVLSPKVGKLAYFPQSRYKNQR